MTMTKTRVMMEKKEHVKTAAMEMTMIAKGTTVIKMMLGVTSMERTKRTTIVAPRRWSTMIRRRAPKVKRLTLMPIHPDDDRGKGFDEDSNG